MQVLKFHVLAVAAALVLAGCSSSLLNNKVGGPVDVQQVPVGNPLALPPDLSLPPPGQSTAAYQPNTAQGTPVDQGVYGGAPAAPAPRAPTQDVYAANGISTVNPDGTKKSDAQLKKELKAALMRKKQAQNPRYGTVFNMGNVFKDE